MRTSAPRSRMPIATSPIACSAPRPRPIPAGRSMPMPKSPRAARRRPPKRNRAAAGLTGSRFALFPALCVTAALCAAVPAVAQLTKSANRAKLSQPAPVNPRQTGNNTFQFALANGMQVLVIPDHRAPVATQMLWFRVGAALHLSHPYGRPVIGWSDEVRRIDRVSAQNFYDHHYAPNNAILVIAGDVTPDEVRKMAQDAYGKAAARELEPRAEFTEPPRLAETRMTITRPDARVPLFSRIYRAPSYAQGRPGQAEALEAYAQLLGGDQTSILYRVLVEQKKLATDAGAGYDGYARDAGEFSVYAVPRPGVSLEALEKAVDQILGVNTLALPRDNDLARAKTQ